MNHVTRSKIFPRTLVFVVIMAVGTCSLTGCGNQIQIGSLASGPQSQKAPDGFDIDTVWVSTKPDDKIMTPSDVKAMEGKSTIATVAGRIDAGEMSPFVPGKFMFMLSEMPADGHAADDPDHADNCPFCKRKLKNAPKAIVQWIDNEGGVVSGDVQAALGLKQGEAIWATGEVRYDTSVNTVFINATGLYRPQANDS